METHFHGGPRPPLPPFVVSDRLPPRGQQAPGRHGVTGDGSNLLRPNASTIRSLGIPATTRSFATPGSVPSRWIEHFPSIRSMWTTSPRTRLSSGPMLNRNNGCARPQRPVAVRSRRRSRGIRILREDPLDDVAIGRYPAIDWGITSFPARNDEPYPFTLQKQLPDGFREDILEDSSGRSPGGDDPVFSTSRTSWYRVILRRASSMPSTSEDPGKL